MSTDFSVSETILQDSKPPIEDEELLIEAHPFLQVLAEIVQRLRRETQPDAAEPAEDKPETDS
ncbi:MAG: hypothetical protein ABI700_24175 [Chloroflexota bacterium]